MRRTETDPKFRNAMYALMIALLLGYVGLKTWHVRLAISSFANEEITHSPLAAK